MTNFVRFKTVDDVNVALTPEHISAVVEMASSIMILLSNQVAYEIPRYKGDLIVNDYNGVISAVEITRLENARNKES